MAHPIKALGHRLMVWRWLRRWRCHQSTKCCQYVDNANCNLEAPWAHLSDDEVAERQKFVDAVADNVVLRGIVKRFLDGWDPSDRSWRRDDFDAELGIWHPFYEPMTDNEQAELAAFKSV